MVAENVKPKIEPLKDIIVAEKIQINNKAATIIVAGKKPDPRSKIQFRVVAVGPEVTEIKVGEHFVGYPQTVLPLVQCMGEDYYAVSEKNIILKFPK